MLAALTLAAALVPVLDPRPPLSDLGRFPPAEVVALALEDADRYARHLAARLAVELDRADALRECARDAAWCREAWILLRAARLEYGSLVGDGWVWVAGGRDALARLRGHVGEAAFYAGEMPPAAPVWRFTPAE